MKYLLILTLLVSSVFAQGADVSADAKLGTAITFSLESVTGTGPFTYQWHKNNVYIPGATQATYTIPSADASSAGAYFVQVSNAQGRTISNNAVVTVSVVVTAPGVAIIKVTFTPAK